MPLLDITKLPRQIRRLAEILFAFARHGFGQKIAQLNLQEHVEHFPLIRRLMPRPADRAGTDEERLVKVFQELGPTFVKLGQILSSRPDIVGESFADAFKKLRDRAEPFDAALAREIVERELRKPISEVFASFSNEPAGSGSIGQVHRATLKDGTPVMVKVRRPGIESTILTDMAILRLVGRVAETQLPEIRPTQVVEEFDRAIRSELDFSVEAANTASFHELFREMHGVRAPAVFWDLTTSAVLTIERLEGVSIGNIEELDRKGLDRRRLARTLAECFVTQYFQAGTFHADPHPGNFVVADDGTIGIIDFGMVGHLSADMKARLTTILFAVVTENIEFVAEVAGELGATGENFDQRQFNRDLSDLYHKYRGMPLGRIDSMRLFGDLTRVARQNDLSLPRDLVLLGKSLAAVSSVARALDPSIDILRMAAPKTSEFVKEKLSPARWAKLAGLNTLGLLHIVRNIPRDLRSIIRKLESGQLQVGWRHSGLERAITELDRASNRLAISIYVAALLVASSLLVHAKTLPVQGVSVPGVLGYGLAGVLSLWLAWGILRSGRL